MADLFQDEHDDIRIDIRDIVLEPERWLDSINDALGGRTPGGLIGTDEEVLLRHLLRRIKHGVML